jgi:hypothetical protein
MTYYTWYIYCVFLVMYEEGVSCLTMEAKKETRASDFSTLAEVLPLLANPRNFLLWSRLDASLQQRFRRIEREKLLNECFQLG